jgi:hypothetical protein
MNDIVYMREVEDTLIQLVSRELEAPYKPEMKIAVEKFFEEVVSRYGKEELQEKLADLGKVMEEFYRYLDSTSCVICPRK